MLIGKTVSGKNIEGVIYLKAKYIMATTLILQIYKQKLELKQSHMQELLHKITGYK